MSQEQIEALISRRRLDLAHAWHLRDAGHNFDRFEPLLGIFILGADTKITVVGDLVHFRPDRVGNHLVFPSPR